MFALESLETVCLHLIQNGWENCILIDEILKKLNKSPNELQERLANVGFDLFRIKMPLSDYEDTYYVALPQHGKQLGPGMLGILSFFVTLCLRRGRGLTKEEADYLFKDSFSSQFSDLLKYRLIEYQPSNKMYVFTPLAKAIFGPHFDKIREVVERHIPSD